MKTLSISREKDSVLIQIGDEKIYLDYEEAVEAAETLERFGYDVEGIVLQDGEQSTVPSLIVRGHEDAQTL